MVEKRNQGTTLLWFARICGIAISATWVYQIISLMIKGGFAALHHQTSTGIILFLLITTLSIGVLIAWGHPMAGGKFIIVLSILFSIFIYFSNADTRLISILYQGLPFFLVGLLFIQSQAGKEETS